MTPTPGRNEIRQVALVHRRPEGAPLDDEERRAAVNLAGMALKGGWSQAAYADVLAAMGLLSPTTAKRVAEETGQDPDPNYFPMCPAGVHPAQGNVVRRPDNNAVRCNACVSEQGKKRSEHRPSRAKT